MRVRLRFWPREDIEAIFGATDYGTRDLGTAGAWKIPWPIESPRAGWYVTWQPGV